MSELLPIFPLPNVVLFPNVHLPLHIFEPRYRDMVADAVQADRLIGMVLLRPGWEKDYEGRPPVYSVGCSGVITHVERMQDGRYNIMLRGLERFRIVHEDLQRRYRRAATETLHERALTSEERAALRAQRARLESLLAPNADSPIRDLRSASAMPDDELVNALAQYLDLDPVEKQALLEQDSLLRRAASLIELIEMKILMARMPAVPDVSH